uniref:E3 ubiquitin-protein ligase hrd-1 n=1 Tax=Syphacia muris TaxID=451379 RepID=A0A0N5AU96_9BILA
MSELPFTVTRRRVAGTSSQLSEPGDQDDKKLLNYSSNAFSSFSNLSQSLWNSAQHTFYSTSSESNTVSAVGNSCNEGNKTTLSSYSCNIEMTFRDRTAEFRTAAKSYQMKVQGNGSSYREHNNKLLQKSIQFNQLAKRVGRDLSHTCAKMEKLTELAKNRSLLDDSMVEMEELSQMIKQDITGLNKQIALLQEHSKADGSNLKADQGHGHSQLVVVGLQSRLASVSKDFQNVLELRTENMKQQKSRREKFSYSQAIPSSLPPSLSSGNMGSVLLQEESSPSSSVAIDMDNMQGGHVLQHACFTMLMENNSYAEVRSSTMESIESSISELGQIFRQLASLVSEQGEMITRIDSNVEETSINVDAAHTELVKYFHSISQNRWLMIKVMYIQGLVAAYILFHLARKLFFGQLRAAETEHLTERTWHAIMETCLAFTVFREDFSPRFVMLFVLLLFVKSFHWLSEDRVDFMERSPIITIIFHVRMMSLLSFLSMLDSYFISHAYFTTIQKGASVQIVFGFEYAILMTAVLHVAIKYILHMHDLHRVHPWENKAIYLLYSELVINLLRCFLYVVFVFVMIRLHTFPLFSIRPLYLSIRAFHKAVTDVILSRRAIHAMNNLFPLATEQELAQGDNTCIICREEMTVSSGPKKLPCNHIFHSNCLRSWFQRQQSCPTCRTDILAQRRNPPAASAAPRPEPAAAQPPFAPPPAQGAVGDVPPNMFPFVAHHFGFPPPTQQQQQNGTNEQNRQFSNAQPSTDAANSGSASTAANNTSANFSSGTSLPFQPPWFLPGFPFTVCFSLLLLLMLLAKQSQNPFMLPPPPMPFMFPSPPSFNGLSDAEVAAMEGRERSAVEARVTCLRNISVLLDAAVVQLQQYCSVVQTLR